MTVHPTIPVDDQKMILHANARGQIRVRTSGDYTARATLVKWIPASKHCRIEYSSGSRCTILKTQVLEVMPLVVVDQ